MTPDLSPEGLKKLARPLYRGYATKDEQRLAALVIEALAKDRSELTESLGAASRSSTAWRRHYERAQARVAELERALRNIRDGFCDPRKISATALTGSRSRD